MANYKLFVLMSSCKVLQTKAVDPCELYAAYVIVHQDMPCTIHFSVLVMVLVRALRLCQPRLYNVVRPCKASKFFIVG